MPFVRGTRLTTSYYRESLCESTVFPEKALAAAVISKVFYHLEELDDSLKYALSAGDHFDVHSHAEYTETLIGTDGTCNPATWY